MIVSVFLHVVRYPWKLQTDPIILVGMVRHGQACPRYLEVTNPQYLHDLMMDLVLNGKYSESALLARSLFNNHYVVWCLIIIM